MGPNKFQNANIPSTNPSWTLSDSPELSFQYARLGICEMFSFECLRGGGRKLLSYHIVYEKSKNFNCLEKDGS